MLKVTGDVLKDELLHVYFKFREAKVHHTTEISPLVMVDYDAEGKLIGIEFSDPEEYGMKSKQFENRIKVSKKKSRA